MQPLFVGSETAHVLRAGPLGKQVDGVVEALRSAGYEPRTIEAKVLIVVQLGRWLARCGLGVRELDDGRVGEFLRLRRRRYRSHGSQSALLQRPCYLRRTGALAPAVVSAKRRAAALIEQQYATYLREERGRAQATLIDYLALVDRFLLDRIGKGPVRLGQLAARDVTRFVLRRAYTITRGRAKRSPSPRAGARSAGTSAAP